MLGAIAVLRQRNVFPLIAAVRIGCFADGSAGSRIIFFASPRAVVVGAGFTFNPGCITGGERILCGVTVTAMFAAADVGTEGTR